MDAVALRIDWYCPTKRRIDCDNALSRCKSYIDGLTLAGWWADDSVIRSVTIAVHLPGERRGVVVITATPE
jgi:Holliday junction resolvase RusA-like endonuclease